jgi:hypothetical protein
MIKKTAGVYSSSEKHQRFSYSHRMSAVILFSQNIAGYLMLTVSEAP